MYLSSLFVILRSLLSFILFSVCFFFFKQKTSYEMRISDWSSDVFSSDLLAHHRAVRRRRQLHPRRRHRRARRLLRRLDRQRLAAGDRKSVGEGKSVSVRVDLGGGRLIKKKKT